MILAYLVKSASQLVLFIGCVNAAHLGLSVPDAIKTVLEQLHDRPDGKEGQ